MRLVYLGSSDFAVPALESLIASRHEVLAVVTQPDRRRGRGRLAEPGVIHACARRAGLLVFLPASINLPEMVESFRALAPDVFVVASYGQKLSSELCELPRLRSINIHASLLPRHRGASPIQQAILEGDALTGISVMYLADRIDAGDVLGRVETRIGADETSGELHDRLARLGSELILTVLDSLEAGQVVGEPQDPEQVTHCRKIRKTDGLIDWRRSPKKQHDFIRAYWPWPKAHAQARVSSRERRVSFRASRVRPGSIGAEQAGQILEAGADGIVVGTGGGRLALTHLQLDGGKVLTAEELLRGHRLEVGDRFEGRVRSPEELA